MMILNVVALLLVIWIMFDINSLKRKKENRNYLIIETKVLLLGVVILLNTFNLFLLTH